jgi:hypothetical protein
VGEGAGAGVGVDDPGIELGGVGWLGGVLLED